MIAIKAEIGSGTPLNEAVSEAINLAKRLDVNVSFEFWGVPTLVSPYSNVSEVIDRHDKKFELMYGGNE